MVNEDKQYTFGPVPSRRLGRSVGINNIPAKVCSYACRYCQVGCTTALQVERQPFFSPDLIKNAVGRRIEAAIQENVTIDFLAFVPDGEPTLDIHLAQEIDMIKCFGLPVGVITNSSLIWREEVREALMSADWVSLKVDSVDEKAWRRINRPHRSLQLSQIMKGALAFSAAYRGRLVTETMLLKGEMEADDQIQALAVFLGQLQPERAYLSVPIRPPAEKGVVGPDERQLNRVFQTVAAHVKRVEYLVGYEGDAFASTGDVERDLLAITAVHPMRRQAVEGMLKRGGRDWTLVESLLAQGLLLSCEHQGNTFLMRAYKR